MPIHIVANKDFNGLFYGKDPNSQTNGGVMLAESSNESTDPIVKTSSPIQKLKYQDRNQINMTVQTLKNSQEIGI